MGKRQTLGIEHGGNVKMLVGNLEGVVQVLDGLVLAQVVEVDEVRAVLVDKSAEGQTILPASKC